MAKRHTEGMKLASSVCKAFGIKVMYSRANPVDDIWDVYIPDAKLSIRCGKDFHCWVRQGRAAVDQAELMRWHTKLLNTVGTYWLRSD